jgi:GNAT superfamily N-acetyltransferase
LDNVDDGKAAENTVVRKYDENDLSMLHELELSVKNFGEPFLESEMRFIKRDSIPEFGAVFVAENGGNIVGYITLSKNVFSVVIDSILVKGDMKRKGVGTALIEKAKEYTRSSGFKILRVDTGDFMDYAIDFYIKAGFLPCGFVSNDWGLNTNQIHFYMDLSE